MPRPSIYIRVPVDKSSCAVCESKLTLLAPRTDMKKESFYICWKCHSIYEVGKEIVNDKEY